MGYFGFRLDELHCIYQRSRTGSTDSDVVTFAVTVGEEPHGGIAGKFVFQSGFHVPAEDVSPDVPGKFGRDFGGWILGPFYAADADLVELKYAGYNMGDLPEGSDDKIAPYELKMLDALYGAAAGEVLGPIASGAAALVGGFGGVVEAALGFKPYVQCDGMVFQDVKQFSGADLSKLPYALQGSFNSCSFTNSYEDSATHDSACGHIAQTEVTFSVLNFGSLSGQQARAWFWPYTDFRRGWRQLVPPGKATSFRKLFCS